MPIASSTKHSLLFVRLHVCLVMNGHLNGHLQFPLLAYIPLIYPQH